MREAEVQWLDIDYSKFTKGQYVINAPQSTNKTGGIGTLEGESVCLIGARNVLLKQTQNRFPNVIQQLHIKPDLNDRGEVIYEDLEVIRKSTNLGINYSSLYKLPQSELRRFRFLLIDEPNLLWSHSTKFKPDLLNELEFKRLVITTPVVIWLGADIDEQIWEEIEYYDQLRYHADPYNPDKPIAIEDRNNLSENWYVRQANEIQ